MASKKNMQEGTSLHQNRWDHNFKAAIASGLKSILRPKTRRTSAGVSLQVIGPEFSPQKSRISDTFSKLRIKREINWEGWGSSKHREAKGKWGDGARESGEGVGVFALFYNSMSTFKDNAFPAILSPFPSSISGQ
ncbi:hypothetical protein OIU79_015791 [Salix purpurea]|uniref:Uncharacterized protein n=1 Tax=Salix purpurea TaxID=77065 RepID=A0A9Q0PDM0_SALPP|nr:hypothetical protein OIU79_015791 [Salix purpurea]